MTRIVSVYATFAGDEEAQLVARALVEERLAACANILGPCRSIYRWRGKVEEAGEVAALFKTSEQCAPRLLSRLAELHSYDVPAAAVWPIADSAGGYADWVAAEVRA